MTKSTTTFTIGSFISIMRGTQSGKCMTGEFVAFAIQSHVEVFKVTEKAIEIGNKDKKCWLPKSQMKDFDGYFELKPWLLKNLSEWQKHVLHITGSMVG